MTADQWLSIDGSGEKDDSEGRRLEMEGIGQYHDCGGGDHVSVKINKIVLLYFFGHQVVGS